ncbi:MAG TPA: glycosyltransferase family 39 protein, partial [Gemmatimonadaceae bacterium]
RNRAVLGAIAVITLAAVARAVFATIITLPPDETYYWEWSRHLAAGYFDHPPAIALFIHAGTIMLGVTPLGVRITSVLAGWGAALCLVFLARRLGGDRAALVAAIAMSCMPLAAAGLILATPDAPLLCAVALTLLAMDHALAAPPGGWRSCAWWLAAGAALGLALISKYNAVLLPLAALIALAGAPSLRRQLRTPGPYAAAVLALLIFTPVVLWNAHNGWASFRFQLAHGLGDGHGSHLSREASLIGGQLALVSPILFIMLAVTVVQAVRARDPRRVMLASVAATIFVFFCVSAWRRPAEANWQAPAYIPAIALLAARPASRTWRRWLIAACALGALMILVMYIQAVVPVLPLSANDDPTARGTGWDSLAVAVQRVAADESARSGAHTWLGGDRYQEASEIGFHLPSHPESFALNISGRPNQYDFWPSFPDRARPGDGLVLALEVQSADTLDAVIRQLLPYFASARYVGVVELRRGTEVRTTRRVWALRGWRGTWPRGRQVYDAPEP